MLVGKARYIAIILRFSQIRLNRKSYSLYFVKTS